MKVAIWSDVRCPFCYIGKRKFEAALEKFEYKDKVEITWHSFQLDPYLKTQTEMNIYDYFADRKGQSREYAKQVHRQVVQTAKEVGLSFNFDKAVIANSFNAHRIIQLAKTKGLGDAAEEQLFKAYFTEGKNIDDNGTLLQIGISIGLNEEEVKETLTTDAYAEAVQEDERKAQTINVRGVPFFVFNDKYVISGAQSPEVFLETLEGVWEEFKKDASTISEGDSCSLNGDC